MAYKDQKVCFIHSYGIKAFENKSVGGTELQLYYLSTKLVKEYGINVDFITGAGEEINECVQEGVKILPYIGELDTAFKKLLNGAKIMKLMKGSNSDIYFTSSDNMLPGLVGLFCLLYGKEHVHRTVHSREFDGELIFRNPLKGIIHYFGLQLSTLIFVQAEDHKEVVSERFHGDIEVMKNSFPIENYGFNSTFEKEYVLWVGRRVKCKRPQIFLDLALEFSQEEFIMISPCTGKDTLFEKKITRRAENIENLTLIERVKRDKMTRYFANSKIFINTSKKEGFPNTFIEAGLAETPIISLYIDPDDFIENYQCGISCNNDYKTFVEGFESLLEEGSAVQIDELGSNCRSYMEEQHNLDENIYQFGEKLFDVVN